VNKPAARRRHPLAGLVVLAIALGVTGGLYALFSPSSPADAARAQSLAIEEGRKLFISGCSSCHGINAQGGSDGPSLIGVGAAAVDFQVSTGRMPAAAPAVQAPAKERVYTDEEISQLAAYIGSLAPGPAIPPESAYDPAEGDVAAGGELFRTNCASCHNFTGQGGALTEGKYAPSLNDTDPKHMYEAMLTGPQAMPVFNDNTLTPEEKRNIIAFLDQVQNEGDPGGAGLGRIGPVSEGLAVWILGIGSIIGVTVWLTARSS
jgi:ubiquinol-cytochrome c reductase cytochrome c subunit